MFTMFIPIFCFFVQALAAPSSPDESWNDFTNNFATDIAPLVILFGEQVTKQFLSESTGLLDNIIFGMAPLGILTAVVSAIRIYGWPGLKAFIGRAQEPHGVAEAELCSSTSHDVCELWSEGGICRVFGRPMVLEFFYKAGKDDFYPKFTESTKEKEVEQPGACNLYRPVCFLDGKKCCRGGKLQKSTDEWADCEEKDSGWCEESAADSTKKGDPDSGVESGEEETKFAPYPNLSLNIGIRATPQWVLILVAAFGSLVQLSFFGYATYVTFYRLDFYTEGKAPETWSFVLTVLGTAMVVLGMILCAFLIERKSCERRFTDVGHYGAEHSKVDTTMYWLQPGNQRVGDQQFSAFSYNKVKHTYITSWKTDQGRDQLGSNYANLILVIGLFSSMAGFILQFTGLRGLHGSVALYQITATLVMSIIRAILRLRRLDPNDNNLRTIGTKIEGHELNWQAVDIFTNHASHFNSSTDYMDLKTPINCFSDYQISPQMKNVKRWQLCDERSHFLQNFSYQGQKNVRKITSEILHSSSCLFGFHSKGNHTHPKDTETWPVSLDCVNEAIYVSGRYEGVYSNGLAKYIRPNPAAMIVLLRSRLSYLTDDGTIGVQPKWEEPAKKLAQVLQSVMQGVANYVFSGNMNIKRKWVKTLALTWHTTAMVEYTLANTTDQHSQNISEPLCISFPMFRYGKEWKISKHRLEAIISLWASSVDRVEASNDLNDKVIFIGNADENFFLALKLWMPTSNLKLTAYDKSATWNEAWSIQDQRLILRKEEIKDDDSGGPQLIILRAESPRINLLAQNIFTIFLSRLAKILKEIEIYEEDLSSVWEEWQAGSHATPPSERFLCLSNTHIAYIAKLFVQSGLGTEEEAFMCMIPVLIQAEILPQKKTIMNSFIQQARRLRRNGQPIRAYAILLTVLRSTHHRSCHKSYHKIREMALREVGELLRKEYLTKNKIWALDRLKEMPYYSRNTIPEKKYFFRSSDLELTSKNYPQNRIHHPNFYHNPDQTRYQRNFRSLIAQQPKSYGSPKDTVTWLNIYRNMSQRD